MKRFLITFLVLIVFLAIVFIGGLLSLGFWLSPQNTLQKSDAIIAISGGETVSRAAEAIRLYQAGWAPVIIFSGAAFDPDSPSNAAAMRRQAVAQGVPVGSILLDENAANTQQNASDVAPIVHSHNFHSVILVTSPYHQRRASLAFAAALGPAVTIINHSTTDQNWRRNRWWATSYSYNLTITELKKTLYVWWSGRQA